MKLIIDIPQNYYEAIKHDVEHNLTDYRPFVIIANGTLLDDVKAEMLMHLSKYSPMAISTACCYAAKLELFGIDVTEEWTTATQNASALEQAYKKGYYEGLKGFSESEVVKYDT